ncbi:MAG TPA: hypothetical protein VLV50_13500 [Stellaceae bacterium]|nr:hypothetical protein [Stellaceae bacterium]
MQLHHHQTVTRARALVAALAFLGLAGAAEAQAITATDLSGSFAPIGTTPALVVPALGDPRVPGERATLFLMNSSASGGNAISCGYSAAISVNGNGTFTLPPQQSMFWPRGSAPRNAIWCVASGAATPMQIIIGN